MKEQQDNLREILGFDPDTGVMPESSSSRESIARYKTPIEKVAIAMGVSVEEAREAFKNYIDVSYDNYVDVDNMFGVRQSFSRTVRNYYMYVQLEN